jgi:hypothetical protein
MTVPGDQRQLDRLVVAPAQPACGPLTIGAGSHSVRVHAPSGHRHLRDIDVAPGLQPLATQLL